jgi:hypothetical protein
VAGEGDALELALEVRVSIWGIGGGGAHRGRLAMAKQIGGVERRRQARVGVTVRVRAVGEDVLGGAVLRVGSRWSEEGLSGLSTVAWFGWRGTAAMERRSSRGRWQGGPISSRRRCGARGGDGNLEGGRVAFCGSSMAVTLWRSGGNGRRRKKGVLHRGGRLLLLKAA